MLFFVKSNLFIFFKNIFYHVTLENIFRILNNSVYFQNIVVCNEPLKASIFIEDLRWLLLTVTIKLLPTEETPRNNFPRKRKCLNDRDTQKFVTQK